MQSAGTVSGGNTAMNLRPSIPGMNTRILIAFSLCGWLASCGSGGDAPSPVQPVSSITSITVNPPTASLRPGGAQVFTATVLGLGSYDASVSWSATGGGSLSSATANPATFTAPGTPATCTLTARSVQDPTKLATVTVIVASGSAKLSFSLNGGLMLEMVAIPPGTFTMGSPETEQGRDSWESPSHPVTFAQAFHIGEKEVTQGQWLAVMGSNPSLGPSGPTYPVDNVSYDDITSPISGFLARLNGMTAAVRPPGAAFRLPTEAEWEYAARATSTSRYFWGNDPSAAIFPSYGWFGWNSGNLLHPSGEKLPNAWGLYDVSGNVMEWCHDFYGIYPSAAQTDPVGPSSGTERVLRGGAAADHPDHCRSARRVNALPTLRGAHMGFRVVLASQKVP